MLLGDASNLYEGDLRRLTRIIRAAITFFGLLLLAVIAFAGWSANKAATDIERTLVENALNQSIAAVLNGQKSVAWWDEAVTNTADGALNLDFADAEFGIYLTETYGHNEIFVLDARDQPIYAYLDEGRAAPETYNGRRAIIAPIVAEARHGTADSRLRARSDEFGRAQMSYKILSRAVKSARWAGHIVSVNGKPAVVGVITIIPNVDLTLLETPSKLLISISYINEEFISKIARTLLLPDLKLTPEPIQASGLYVQPFMGDDGKVDGYLSWTTRRPGQVLLTVILPLVACGVFATGLLSSHMFGRLKRASDELTQREARARHAAKHDALSGLPNRQHLIEEVDAKLGAPEFGTNGQQIVAAYLDIDRFKDINDTLGHETGDKLIKAVSKRLAARLRAHDFLARFGGDEFAVLSMSPDVDADTRLAARIASAFEEPFAIEGQSIRVTASVGIARAPDHGRSADELMRHADIALYEAKSQGRDRAMTFSSDMARQVETRRSIEVDLRTAIEREELKLFYQPIISCRTGAIVGAEALLRWRHPLRGEISPATFIPIAEISGLMPSLGTWMLERAFQDAKRWPDLELAVNLSPVQFNQTDLQATLRRLTTEHDVAPNRIVLEITEGVLLEATDQTKAVLQGLQEMGFRTALDDFGTGYSSLAYLCNFKFDKIKIDRSFVSNVSNALTSRAIVQSVASLGRGLGMQIVAEGVETEYEAVMMSHFGCTELQGYFFSKPIPAADLSTLLEKFEPRHMVPFSDLQTVDPPRSATA
ncbi:EAL domain-containing protein [Hyphomicrobium sp. CS1GBMeth3]|uniref:putative bifunctional diguanylate cyclase/phosphodiesterase n=1 Tax=Hyphomicrobium sp. CS1GBMeth3 TaxID=1892845 RepID=UPI000931A3EE|nr:EAL domain-containing protein [Hyphomicrobium sp. CS1GBMeth3]